MWLIGFEFELNSLEKKYIKSTSFIKNFVEDESCYAEAISNPIELTLDKHKQEKIFDIFYDHRYLINTSTFDSNCGGHMTISNSKYSGKQIFEKIKKYAPLIYALNSRRLASPSCCFNLFLNIKENTKFSPIYFKENLLEIRLFSTHRSLKKLVNRYKLIGKICEAIDNDFSYNKLLLNVKPLLKEIYPEKILNNIINESYYFDKMIKEKYFNKIALRYINYKLYEDK
tara:strand:- start:2 stop:685 length:684 start_codon:yes stop_codon:yes gene_type:complete